MADEVLHTEDNHCQPILVNGELMPTVPEYMPSLPITLKGIKRHFVCKLAASTTTQDTTTMSTTESATSHPTTTTASTTTQDTTTMSTTESATSHPTTTTASTTTQDTTTMSTTESATSHPTTTTASTTTQDTTTMSTTESATSHPTTTTASTTTQDTTTMSTTESATSHPTTTTDDFRNLIICENESEDITCSPGEVISILSAIYGRTDPVACPHERPGIMENTACFLDVAADICQPSGSACNFHVGSAKFGDPCGGTYKYLNFTYTCIQGN
ncbi:salivary glue protein Sgs-3-like [Strongylocentrotus purpuratus]|uniref:SUEL-type lectin domain-containing protein n=1 Tax=Strongylocentrotus purpuratus TaxID=7668 RepID=A0A7M7P6T0_STRPU|nr:salivary glue protein Sgs-3-like [Strongylocentrotus purpuratus]